MIAVAILGDTGAESGESFSVVLSAATNAVIADAQGIGTILNDDEGKNQMFGFGAIVDGRLRQRFVFRVTQGKPRDHARLEFWSSEPVKGKAVDDDDRPGHRHDYGHDHRTAKNRFESTVISSMTFGPRDKNGQSVAFSGSGLWNGKSGFTFEAQATDRGDPGRGRDTFMIVIKDSRGAIVMKVNATIDEGNIQSPASKH